MRYSIRVNEVKNMDGNIRGFATVVFSESFKVTKMGMSIRMCAIRLQRNFVKDYMGTFWRLTRTCRNLKL